jgi:hypothetical protein
MLGRIERGEERDLSGVALGIRGTDVTVYSQRGFL